MRLWIYNRPFHYEGKDYIVEITLTFTKLISRLLVDGRLIDEDSYHFMDGLKTLVHTLPKNDGSSAHVEVGYYNWWNIGIAIFEADKIVYESHPGQDVRFGIALSKNNLGEASLTEGNRGNWERNKYSIFADIILGAIFFIVGKLTEDLALAAIVGAGAGLALVVLQRFVKVDLLGGFAVFGTIMLVISGGFSLAFQDDYWVQMKSTVLGLLTAMVFMIDGLLRKGAYFGVRIERYLPFGVHHGRIAIGMSLAGIVMALSNYLVAQHFTEDFWLTYTTFLDIPLSITLTYLMFFWARKGVTSKT